MSGRIRGKSSTSATRRAVWVQDFGNDLMTFKSVDLCDSLRSEAFARMQALLYGHDVKVTIKAIDAGGFEVMAERMASVPGWLTELADRVTVVLQQDGVTAKKGKQ